MIDEGVSLGEARDEFVTQWGIMGAQWGINRTMAQIHALLMTAPDVMSTDEVMETLEISRGNAHTNLKDLVSWGLIRIVTKKGERKEFFEAEKDVWEIFRRVARERKRREIEPALETLRNCKAASEGMKSPEGRAFHEQMDQLEDFVSFASRMGDRVASMQHGKAIKLAMKFFS
ncbi:MAG: transcriptional regulator [Verrucomicrobia bacterium]|jgi:DNA-binding transcriptional regulator GbsR (MarR family)|nr:transcriptional regulator [Verrucomicrobiota bacterium]MDA7507035.1 transcriptional regulator [Akkermansiaceae bacterium]MDA7520446.1 transcriptional regulator [bacterium]MBT6166931.1 transcriptional regulator [Verrucomicrobiota bacterium]MBT7214334.1 transcriptional regulator [Verrucomicrobiota bacterium]